MKKIIYLVLLVVLVIAMALTVPDKAAHETAMINAVKEYVDEEAQNHGIGDDLLSIMGKKVIVNIADAALSYKLKEHDYYLFNTTSVRLKGKDQLMSVGLLGHVFTFDKEMLREKLEEAFNKPDGEK